MMDHSVKQEPSYNKPTKQELFEEYKKAIPELTISDVERKQTLIESQEKEITELSKKDKQIQELQEDVQKLKNQRELVKKQVVDEIKKYAEKEGLQLKEINPS